MDRIWLFAILSLAVLFSVAAAQEDEILTKQLCNHDKSAPEITRISEVKSIIDALKTEPDCPAEVRDAINSLKYLIGLEDVCSEHAIDAIISYWSRFINGTQKKSTPKQIKRFFIGFGLQVSKTCKEALIRKLPEVEIEHGIKKQDFKVVTKEMEESKQVRALFGNDLELESLMLLAPGARRFQKTEVIALHPKEKMYFDLKEERCSHLFKPIYDELILPVVRLAAIGLNYKGPSIANELQSFIKTPLFETWVNVIFVCEPVTTYVSIIAPAIKQGADGDQVLVYVLNEDEIAELKKSIGLTFDEPKLTRPFRYTVGAKLEDQITDNEDDYLTKSIRHYGRGLKELTKTRMKLVKRFVPVLRYAKKSKLFRVGLTRSNTSSKEKKHDGLISNGKRRGGFKTSTILKIIVGTAAGILLALALATPIGTPMWIAFGAAVVLLIFISVANSL